MSTLKTSLMFLGGCVTGLATAAAIGYYYSEQDAALSSAGIGDLDMDGNEEPEAADVDRGDFLSKLWAENPETKAADSVADMTAEPATSDSTDATKNQDSNQSPDSAVFA